MTTTMTHHEQWELLIRAYWPTVPEQPCREITQALVDAEGLGQTSCVWHEVYLWQVKNIQPNWPRCDICGGRMMPSKHQARHHELCRLRKARGIYTPQINAKMRCGCSPCMEEAKHGK